MCFEKHESLSNKVVQNKLLECECISFFWSAAHHSNGQDLMNQFEINSAEKERDVLLCFEIPN